jgi:hypothetical protein
MEMSGEQSIAAPKQAVWEALNDPEVLKACITGCQSLEKTTDTHLEATVKAAVGPVKATFKGEVDLEDLNPPNSYKIVGQGKGGAAGFAKGGADVALEEEDGGTLLKYNVKANVGGQLARIGSRLIDGAAKKYADEFFSAFKAHVEKAEEAQTASAQDASDPAAPEAADTPAEEMPSDIPAEAPAEEAAPAQTAITPEPESEATGGIPAFVWGGALAVAVVLAAIFLL